MLNEDRALYFGGYQNQPTRSHVFKYMSGWCPYYALAMHDLYGYAIVSNGAHFANKIDDDHFIDIRGIAPLEQFLDNLSGKFEVFTRDELIDEIQTGRFKCGYFLEKDLTVAKNIIKKYKPILTITESILVSEPSGRGISKFWEDCTEELDRLVSEYRHSGDRPRRWRVVPANLIKMVWRDSAKLGFVRSNRAITTIANLFYQNIVALQVNNEIAEHDMQSKEEVLADYDFEDSDEMELFVDWAIECSTGWRISDYGIKPLTKYAAMLADEPSDEDKLQICDAILNVVHPRSDLASWFVEGGSATMSEIADQGLTESDELPAPMASLAQFLSDPRPVHQLYRNGDVLTYKGDIGEVSSSNERSVSLRMKDGTTRIVRRNDPDLDVAPYKLWESTDGTPYGYWISPTGESYPVGHEQHDSVIYEIENISYGDAIYQGWIRVVSPRPTLGKWHVEAGAGTETPRAAISALRSVMDERGAFMDVHNLNVSDADEVLVSYQTENSKQTIAILNAYRQGFLFGTGDYIRFQTS